MFAYKKKYFFIVENIKDINLSKIKPNRKFFIIYRNRIKNIKLEELQKFRRKCKTKGFKFIVANDIKLNNLLNTDGIYLSSFNNSLKSLSYKSQNKIIIGSAHNLNEISQKKKQGCNYIFFSKLFRVDYTPKSIFMGILKFNNIFFKFKNIIPLGGIKFNNLNKMKSVKADGFAIMSEIKKKPAISNRLF